MINFKEIEEEAKKIQKKEDIKKAVSNDKKRKKLFSFLEGPPTANAPPGLHHLEVRTYKDIINKFKYMQGFNVPRKAGWDCHGLPVEVQIEKKLQLNSKKDIVKYGEEKFIKDCRDSVFSYIQAWNASTEKLGYWIDLENRYATLDNNYIESVWWSLKQLYDKKLLYEAHKVVPFCPRCQTPLSSHEVAQGYKSVKEESVIIKVKIQDKNEYFLVWTTTPWTLFSNVGIAVNADIDYAYVQDDKIYILAKNLAEKFFPNSKIIKTVKGKELVGIKYDPIFPYYNYLTNSFRVILGDFVTTNDGTGIVHIAPAFGEVDYDVAKLNNLDFVQPVDETGKFTEEVKEYQGKFIKDTDKEIISRLHHEDKLFKVIKYEHDYPFCWRCSSPLMYYAIKSWFIKVTAYKEKLIKNNQKINWVPKNIKDGRFGEWLANVKDWALSRKKFWGTPLPIWRCSCGNEEIIGSIKDLKKNSTRKISDDEIDLHKPWINNIKLKCKKCKNEMSRVLDVIDCWYDSGSAQFAQFHYPFENKNEFNKRNPYDFIAEAIDQTRGWFYTLHVLSTILFDRESFKNVICAGHIIDEKGEKMSKSKGNILNPDEVLNQVGIDATRLHFCISDIGEPKRFSINIVKQDIFPFLNILWNTYQFYNQINNSEKSEEKIEDKWIISRLHSVIEEATENLNKFYIEKALKPIIDFVVNNFSKTYIKMIREREDKNVKIVIGNVLDNVSRLLAIYAPNMSEVIHQSFAKESVHLSSWPKSDKKKIDSKLEKEFELVLKIIETGLSERDKIQIGLKWPLSKAVIKIEENISPEMNEIIKSQLNVKDLEFKNSKELKIELDVRITPELEAEGFAREVSRNIQAFRKELGLNKNDKVETILIVDDKFKKILEKEKDFLKERTNSKKLEIITTPKETFKKKHEFNIKDKSGVIVINY